MKEAVFERALIGRLRQVDGRIQVLKFTPAGRAGFHDRVVLLPGGRALFVELKAPGKELRKLQAYRQRRLRALGFACLMVNSYDLLEWFLDYVERELAS